VKAGKLLMKRNLVKHELNLLSHSRLTFFYARGQELAVCHQEFHPHLKTTADSSLGTHKLVVCLLLLFIESVTALYFNWVLKETPGGKLAL
jgi:hypothetical protein